MTASTPTQRPAANSEARKRQIERLDGPPTHLSTQTQVDRDRAHRLAEVRATIARVTTAVNAAEHGPACTPNTCSCPILAIRIALTGTGDL